jgi:hypothetical protein
MDKHEIKPADIKPAGAPRAADVNDKAVLPPTRQATAAPNTLTAPPGGSGIVNDIRGHVEKLRTLAACLESGNLAGAKAELLGLLEDLFAQWHPDSAPLAAGVAGSPAVDDANRQALKAHADRIEEFCQHAEGGTGHPVARAAVAGGGGFRGHLLSLVIGIVADLLARQKA